MAFDIRRFSRVSLADNTGQLTLQDSSVTNAPAYYTYCSALDSIADIEAADYFADESVIFNLQVNDVIMVVADDASEFLQVLTVDTSAFTLTTTPFTASASVDTANIVDGAVTNAKVNAAAAIDFSKLAALPSADILVGSAGNVPTAVAMSGDVTIDNSGVTAIGAGKVLSSMVSPLLIQYAAVSITAAQFNGMYAAPKLLLASGGSDTLIVLKQAQLLMTYNSAAYADGGTAAIQYGSTVNGAGVIASTTLANTLFQGSVSIGLNMNAGVVTETFSTCVDEGLYLSNIGGAYTTGDSAFVMHLWYSVIPTV